jgi:hypothetical protein
MTRTDRKRRQDLQTLSRGAADFRYRIIDGLLRPGASRFWYLDENTAIGVCSICGAAVSVRFHGLAARGDLRCFGGCTEADVAAAIGGLETRP